MANTSYDITSGFYDSVSGDRKYFADQMNMPYKRIVSEGIFGTENTSQKGTDFNPVITNSTNRTFTVSNGVGILNGKWFEMISTQNFTADANNTLSDRKDSIIIAVDTSSSVRKATIEYRVGSGATAPALVNNAGHKELRVCNVVVKSLSSGGGITIEDTRGTSECPIIVGLLKELSADDFLTQFKNTFNAFQTNYQEFETTFEGLEDDIEGLKSSFNSWYSGVQSQWTTITDTFDEIESSWASIQSNWSSFYSTAQSNWSSFYSSTQSDWTAFKSGKESDWTSFKNTKNTDWTSYKSGKDTDWASYKSGKDSEWSTYKSGKDSDWTSYKGTKDSDWTTFKSGKTSEWTTWFNQTKEEWDEFINNTSSILSVDVITQHVDYTSGTITVTGYDASKDKIIVYINGLYASVDDDYTLSYTGVISFKNTINSGAVIDIVTYRIASAS